MVTDGQVVVVMEGAVVDVTMVTGVSIKHEQRDDSWK